MLNLVRRCRSREAQMLLPTLVGIGEVGVDVTAVKHVSGTAGVENPVRWYRKGRQRANRTCFVVPNQAALSQRHPADPAAAAAIPPPPPTTFASLSRRGGAPG